MEGHQDFIEKSKNEQWKELAETVDSFSREDPIPMDEGIKETVVSLMAHEFRTVASCFGHVDQEDGTPYPWVAIRGDKSIDDLFNDTRIEENNTKYFREAVEGEELLTQGERDEIQKLQNLVRASNEVERQRLLALLDEFYSTHDVEPGIKLTVSPVICWLCPEEVANDADETREKIPAVELEIKLEKYRQEMNAFTNFLKDKFLG